MADSTIWDLATDRSGSQAAGDLYAVQHTSSATRAEKITFAAMGGLEVETTYDTAADHADISAAVGKLYLVDMSALASDMVLTLPVAASANTGERVGVFVVVGDDAYELDLKSGAAGDLINRVDHSSTSWSRLFITGEIVIFRCEDGSTGDWVVEHDGRIAASFAAELTTDADGESAATWTVPTAATSAGAWTEDSDVGDVFTVATSLHTARRAGTWLFGITARSLDSVTVDNYFGIQLWDGSAALTHHRPKGPSTDKAYSNITASFLLASGDTTSYRYISQEGGKGLDSANSFGPPTQFWGVEVLS